MVPKTPIRGVLEHLGFELKDRPGKVKCVFHDDSVASGLWNEHYYTCFACGVHGDAPRLLHDHEGLEWGGEQGAYAEAARLAGEAVHAVGRKPGGGGGLPGGPGLRGGDRRKDAAGVRR